MSNSDVTTPAKKNQVPAPTLRSTNCVDPDVEANIRRMSPTWFRYLFRPIPIVLQTSAQWAHGTASS